MYTCIHILYIIWHVDFGLLWRAPTPCCLAQHTHLTLLQTLLLYTLQDGTPYDRALPAFVILGFTRFLVSSSYILVNQTIRGEDGEERIVVWWQGSVRYGSIQHIAYFIPAIGILLVFVLPTFLLLTLPRLAHTHTHRHTRQWQTIFHSVGTGDRFLFRMLAHPKICHFVAELLRM